MNKLEIETEIEKQWRPGDKRCGQLIHFFSGVFHYGVGLNSKKMISWGGPDIGSKGCLVIHDLDESRFSDAQWVKPLPLEQIKRNILGSVTAFHDEMWLYNLFGWNCEHWARLVTTGEPISYQIRDWPGWLINFLCGGNLHWRGEAIPHLEAHVGMLTQKKGKQ